MTDDGSNPGANGAALLRQFLRVEAGLHDEPEHSALMEEAWLRASCRPYWQVRCFL